MRPKVRRGRLRQAAMLSLILVLGATAALTLRHINRTMLLPRLAYKGTPRAAQPRAFFRGDKISVELSGMPESLGAAVLAYWNSQAQASLAERTKAVKSRFPCLKEPRVRRQWLRRSAQVRLEARACAARIAGGVRYLSDAGEVFEACPGLAPEGLVELEPGRADDKSLRELARALAAAVKPGVLASPLARARWISPSDGWEAELADGTTVRWGDLAWTSDKLMRLRQVIADARLDHPGRLAVDLRYFEDGKILVKPVK